MSGRLEAQHIDAIHLLLDAAFESVQYGGVLGPDKTWPAGHTAHYAPVHQR